MEPPADVPPAPPPPAEDRYRCPRCGAPHDAFQEYCLECGARLVPYARAASLWRRDAWARESPLWFWATFLTLLLIALAAAAIVIAATDGDERERRPRAAPPGTSTFAVVPTDETTTPTLPDTLTVAPPPVEPTTPTLPTTGADGTTTGANGTTTGANGTTGTTGTTTGQTTTGTSGTVIAWPTDREGFTVILASIPTSRGRAAAEAQAREAIRKGLTEVGVLDSSNYSSLTAGYYVVFTGIHDTAAEARAALPRAVNAGYPRAYYREITP